MQRAAKFHAEHIIERKQIYKIAEKYIILQNLTLHYFFKKL